MAFDSEVLVLAGGVVYQGHIHMAAAGRMVLVGRVVGTPDPPREIPLELALVTAVGLAEKVDVDDAELLDVARRQVAEARDPSRHAAG